MSLQTFAYSSRLSKPWSSWSCMPPSHQHRGSFVWAKHTHAHPQYFWVRREKTAFPDVCIGKLANERKRKGKQGGQSHGLSSTRIQLGWCWWCPMSQLLLTSAGAAPIPMMSFHKKKSWLLLLQGLWRIPTLNGSEPNLCLLPLQSLEKCR